MTRRAVTSGLLLGMLLAAEARAEFREVKQTIYGMD
jgi:hypothetical protein